jgi:hypothetical protein
MSTRDKLLTAIQRLNEKGYTNYRIWKETGISQSTIDRIAGGKTRSPNIETADQILDFARKVRA